MQERLERAAAEVERSQTLLAVKDEQNKHLKNRVIQLEAALDRMDKAKFGQDWQGQRGRMSEDTELVRDLYRKVSSLEKQLRDKEDEIQRLNQHIKVAPRPYTFPHSELRYCIPLTPAPPPKPKRALISKRALIPPSYVQRMVLLRFRFLRRLSWHGPSFSVLLSVRLRRTKKRRWPTRSSWLRYSD